MHIVFSPRQIMGTCCSLVKRVIRRCVSSATLTTETCTCRSPTKSLKPHVTKHCVGLLTRRYHGANRQWTYNVSDAVTKFKIFMLLGDDIKTNSRIVCITFSLSCA